MKINNGMYLIDKANTGAEPIIIQSIEGNNINVVSAYSNSPIVLTRKDIENNYKEWTEQITVGDSFYFKDNKEFAHECAEIKGKNLIDHEGYKYPIKDCILAK